MPARHANKGRLGKDGSEGGDVKRVSPRCRRKNIFKIFASASEFKKPIRSLHIAPNASAHCADHFVCSDALFTRYG